MHEERRLRTDSTPIGKFQEQFDAMFWESSPYSWPVVGWPSDLEGMTREEALAFFDQYYAPNNLAAALVGDFDPEAAIAMAERYFGTHSAGRATTPLEPRTREMPQLAEKRMVAYAETNPQVVVRYHSVPDGHVDEPALVVLGQLLNGRTGRLYKALVEDQQVATNASGGQSGFKFEGMFELRGTAAQERTPEEVEQALYAALERLKTEPVTDRELQKVKNQNAASNFRDLQGNFQLMMNLLIRDGNRGWETINTDPPRYDAVTAEDIMRVATTYFTPETRAVAIYYRQEGGAEEHPLLAGLDDQERQQVQQTMTMMAQLDEDQLRPVPGAGGADGRPGLSGEPGHGRGHSAAHSGTHSTMPEVLDDLKTTVVCVAPRLTHRPIGHGVGQTIPSHPRDLTFDELEFEPPAAARHRHTLSNGVVVFVVEDHALPLVSVSVTVRTRQLSRPAGQDRPRQPDRRADARGRNDVALGR